MSYIERELLLIGVDGCISVLHAQAKGEPIQESAIKLVEETRDYIAALSPADVAPVKHGRWNDINPTVLNPGVNWICRCSLCGCPQDYKHNYCPNCGALMREVGNGEK